MQFLAPLFLAAAAAIAIPIVLHLIQREKRDATPFPSLMFLKQIPHRSTRKRRLRDLPLLALRILALLLIAVAFSHPLLERSDTPVAAAGGAREVVLLLDRSYSMTLAGRWEEARNAALAEVDRLGPEDRMSIIAFDGGAAVLNQPTRDASTLRGLLGELRPGWGITRYDPALRLAGNLLNASNLPRREVVVVSDFQRTGTGDGLEAKLPAGTEVRTVPLAGTVEPNLAVAGVTFRREVFQGQERVTAIARVVNTTDGAVSNAPLTLDLDGRTVRSMNVSVAPHGAASVTFPEFTLSQPVRGTVTVGRDALPADDVYGFALTPGEAIGVLTVDNGRSGSLFLGRALAVGGEPGFDVRERSGALPAADLRVADVVLLNDAPAPSADAVNRLREFVERGGGLIVALGPSSGSSPELAQLLPGTPGQVVDRTQSGGAALGYLDLEHPAFDVFRAPRSGDLTAPRFFRYRALQVPPADSSVSVLARFDDGTVALAERRVGRGRVLAWASTLDREWNDLAVQPIYVPFVHQLTRHAAGFEQPRGARTVGDVVDARSAANAADDVALIVAAPDGTRSDIEPGARALTLEQRGFYTIRSKQSRDAVLATIAANVDVKESDLSALPPEELAAGVRTPGEVAQVANASALSLQDLERRQALWWYLLAAALALLAIETALSNRASRRAVRAREV